MRIAPPPLASLACPAKNVPYFSDLRAAIFPFKRMRTFLQNSALNESGRWWGFNTGSVLPNYFLRKRIWQNLGKFFIFWIRQSGKKKGSGENEFPLRSCFWFAVDLRIFIVGQSAQNIQLLVHRLVSNRGCFSLEIWSKFRKKFFVLVRYT